MIIVGAGKAAASLAKGLEQVLGDRIDAGCIVVKYGHTESLQRIRQFEASHPLPDEAGYLATLEILKGLVGLSPNDRVFILLTGGASALLVAPVPEITLEEKAVVTDLLMRAGAPIDEMNLVRTTLSRVKGGGLLDAIGPAPSMTLVISDVPGDRASTIGSGPTIREHRSAKQILSILRRYGLTDRLPPSAAKYLNQGIKTEEHAKPHAKDRLIMIADSQAALAAAAAAARAEGCGVTVVEPDLADGTHEAAERIAAAISQARRNHQAGDPPHILLAAGETTLEVRGNGLGGRNQEFALVAARRLAGLSGTALLTCGTDGTDGPTDAAGAFVDGSTCERAQAAGFDIDDVLARNDSYWLFSALGDLEITGPTGTNVMDLIIGVVF